MATNSKNTLVKGYLLLCIMLMMIGALTGALYGISKLVYYSDYLNASSYYETRDFTNDYYHLTHNVSELYTSLVSENSIKSQGYEDDQALLLVGRYRTILDNLKKAKSFHFLLVDEENGGYMGGDDKLTPSQVMSRKTGIKWDYAGALLSDQSIMKAMEYDYYNWQLVADIYDFLGKDHLVLYTYVDEASLSEDTFFSGLNAFSQFKSDEALYWTLTLVGSLLILVGMAFITLLSGRKALSDEVHLWAIDRIPLEIQWILVGLSSVPMIILSETMDIEIESYTLWLVIASIDFLALFCLIHYQSLVRLFKAKRILKSTLVYIILHKIIDLIGMKYLKLAFKRRQVMLVLGLGFLFFISGFLVVAGGLGLILYLILNALLLRIAYAYIKSMDEIMKTIALRAEGNLDEPLDVDRLNKEFASMGKNLNALQEGLKNALQEAIVGEKMKSELITNVTHDLKNPLTSIITYVDLLSKCDVTDATAKDYIGVLDQKAYRLKILIDQLVEAAKASSGNIPIDLRDLDFIQLLNQIGGEYEEVFGNKGLTMVVSAKEPIGKVKADGAILHRIVDNLMSNISKYALEGTRVYIEVEEKNKGMLVTFKNISKLPLNKPIEDLMQRFVRGDDARITEGNGLGLSIASNLAALLKGELEVTVDGDLFKTALWLRWVESPEKP